MAEMSSLLREALNLNAIVAATERCSRTMKRLDDLRAATEVREDGLNKVFSDLEARVKTQFESELTLNFTISELRKGEGVDWETAIEAEGFAPVRETLFNLALKSTKESVQAEYPELNLDFLVVEEDEGAEDTQSGTTNLGVEGQKTAPINDEAIDQGPAKNEERIQRNAGDEVDIHLLEE